MTGETEVKISSWTPGCGLSILYGIAGLATLVGVLRLGPVDLTRTVYNQIIGDVPALKRDLVEYAKGGIKREKFQRDAQESAIENMLAIELGVDSEVLRNDPNQVSIERLWDVAET